MFVEAISSRFFADEENVQKSAFEIIMAFDELVSASGYREMVTLHQIETALKMDSIEERRFLAEEREKQRVAAIEAKKKAEEMARVRKEMGSRPRIPGTSMSSDDAPFKAPARVEVVAPVKKERPSAMKLGAKAKPSFLDQMRDAGELVDASTAPKPKMMQAPIVIRLEEKMMCVLERGGFTKQMKVMGKLSIAFAAGASRKIVVSPQNWPESHQLAPKMDKAQWTSHYLALSDPEQEFPETADLFKWRIETDKPPLIMQCWVDDDKVSLTLSSTRTLTDIFVTIPVPNQPEDLGADARYTDGAVLWHVSRLEAGTDVETLEFSIDGEDEDEFFPISADFASAQLISDISIDKVVDAETGKSLKFSVEKSLCPKKYLIE